jgi:hypothetical protein
MPFPAGGEPPASEGGGSKIPPRILIESLTSQKPQPPELSSDPAGPDRIFETLDYDRLDNKVTYACSFQHVAVLTCARKPQTLSCTCRHF